MLLICTDCSEIRMIPFNSGIVNMQSKTGRKMERRTQFRCKNAVGRGETDCRPDRYMLNPGNSSIGAYFRLGES